MDPIVKPMEYAEAVKRLGGKVAVGAALSSSQWSDIPLALRMRAFWSAKLAEASVASGLQGRILTAASKSEFVAKARPWMIEQGFAKAENQDDLKSHTSTRRLELIFEQNTQSARGYGWWKQGQQPDVMDAFPAQRFLRVEARRVPRAVWQARWLAAGGRVWDGQMIALKSDPVWAKLSRFGTPWPPYDFGSGMGVEDVSREEAEALGLLKPGQLVEGDEKSFNEQVSASVKDLDPLWQDWLVGNLRSTLGDSAVEIADGRVWMKGEAPKPAPLPAPVPALLSIASSAADVRALVAVAKDRAEANAAMELPAALRGQLKSRNRPGPVVRKAVEASESFLSRVVHKDLHPNYAVQTTHVRASYDHLIKTVKVRPETSCVVHETAHAIEIQNPGVYEKCHAFLVKRAAGKDAKWLGTLTGNMRYKHDEMAFEDEWVKRGGNVYTGKKYDLRATEILSMGLQRLFEDSIGFAKNDPEYFDFILSIIRKSTP